MNKKKGKKSKKSKSAVKPRTAYTYFTSKEEVTAIDISYNPADQSFSTTMPIVNSYHQVTYDRDSKPPKTLSITPLSGGQLHLDANSALRCFDTMIAIDTNDKIINGENHSATGIIFAEWLSDKMDPKHTYSYETPFCIEYLSLLSPREIIGWCIALQHLNTLGLIKSSAKIALIVDSYLEDLPKFNSRIIPLYEDFYLPRQFTLIYASADAGAEFIANQLLKNADKASSLTLEYIATHPEFQYPAQGYTGPWEKVRFITSSRPT
ncbi:hypothetical protein [Pseudomonas sp. Irchel s3h9]|uniref:hypothetical protein n=1 Tax=Pseudomonas sp. Irchel s3h9 TaxID=2009192 RepID=UPI000BA4605B|nr:hypothetical protein [Pseudomonas sp. Irchel s3h9]